MAANDEKGNTMKATVRLMQESGVQGPSGKVEAASRHYLEAAARKWAAGQTGHPWDVLTISCDGIDWEVPMLRKQEATQ